MMVSLQFVIAGAGLLAVVVLLSILFPVILDFSSDNIDALIHTASQQRILRAEEVISHAINNALDEVHLAGNQSRRIGLPLASRSSLRSYQRMLTALALRDSPTIMFNARSVLCRFRNGNEALTVTRTTVGLVQVHNSTNGIYQWEWGKTIDRLEQLDTVHLDAFSTRTLKCLPKGTVRPLLLTSKGFAQGVLWNATYKLRVYEEQQAAALSSPTGDGTTSSSSKLTLSDVRVDPWYVRLQAGVGEIGGMLYPIGRMVFEDETGPVAQRKPLAFCTSFLGDVNFGTVLSTYVFGENFDNETSRAYLIDSQNLLVAASHPQDKNLEETNLTNNTARVNELLTSATALQELTNRGCYFYNAASKWQGCLKGPDKFPLLHEVQRQGGWDLSRPDDWRPAAHGGKADALGFRETVVNSGGRTYIATSKTIRSSYSGFSFRLLLFVPQDHFTEEVDAARNKAVGGSVAIAILQLGLYLFVLALIGRRTRILTRKMVRPWTSAGNSAAAAAAATTTTIDETNDNNISSNGGGRGSASSTNNNSKSNNNNNDNSQEADASGDDPPRVTQCSQSEETVSSGQISSNMIDNGGDDDDRNLWFPWLTHMSTILHLEELETLEQEFFSMGFYIEKLRGFVNPAALRAQLKRENPKSPAASPSASAAAAAATTTTFSAANSGANISATGSNESPPESPDGAPSNNSVAAAGAAPAAAASAETAAAEAHSLDSIDSNSRSGSVEGTDLSASDPRLLHSTGKPKRVTFAATKIESSPSGVQIVVDASSSVGVSPTGASRNSSSSISRHSYPTSLQPLKNQKQQQLFCVIWFDFPLVQKMVEAISKGHFYDPQHEMKQPGQQQSIAVGGSGGQQQSTAATQSVMIDLIALTSAVAKQCHHLQSRPITIVEFLGDAMLVCFRLKNLLVRSRILDGVLRRVIKDAHAVHRKLSLRNEFETVFGGPRQQNSTSGAAAAAAGNIQHQEQQQPKIPAVRRVFVTAGICVGYMRAIVRSETDSSRPINNSSGDGRGSHLSRASQLKSDVTTSSDDEDGIVRQVTFMGNAVDNARRISQCMVEHASSHIDQLLDGALIPDAPTSSTTHRGSSSSATRTPRHRRGDQYNNNDDDDDAGTSGSSRSSTNTASIAAPTASSPPSAESLVAGRRGVASANSDESHQQKRESRRLVLDVPYAVALPTRLQLLLGTTQEELMPLPFRESCPVVRFSGTHGAAEQHLLGVKEIGGGCSHGSRSRLNSPTAAAIPATAASASSVSVLKAASPSALVLPLSRVIETPETGRFIW